MADPLDARDDKAQRVPAIDFLDQVPTKVRAEMQAVLEAVAEAPPPAFSGGGKWEVMHDDMAGFYERVRGADRRNRGNYPLDVGRHRRYLPGPATVPTRERQSYET